MADLTRLSTIAIGSEGPASVVAAVLYQLGVEGTVDAYLSAEEVERVVGWLAACPQPALPRVLPNHVLEYVRRVAPSLENAAGVCDDIAYYLKHFGPAPSRYTREDRNKRVNQIAANRKVTAGSVSLGAVEMALLSAVTRVGFTGAPAAVASVARMRTFGVIEDFEVETMQHVCTHYRVICSVDLPGRERFPVITPWCVSRESAVACAGVHLASVGGELATKVVQRRAVTVASYIARADLESVRTVVAPAIQLVTRYAFDPVQLALVAHDGRVIERITSRNHAAIVAFAFLTSRGTVDPLALQNRLRVDLVDDVDTLPAAVGEYYNGATDVSNTLLLFSRALHITRKQREQMGRGDDVNKGPCLGYVAQGRTKRERNTASCINRISEALLEARSLGQDPAQLLFIVEWGGQINPAVVLAYAAIAKIDCALEVGAAGVDVGGKAEVSKASKLCHFTAVLRYRPGRALPVCCDIEYDPSHGVNDRVRAVVSAVGEGASGYVFLSGGVPAVADISAERSVDDVCSDVYAVMSRDVSLPCVIASSDFIIPPPCPHLEDVTPEGYVDCGGVVDPLCEFCVSTSRRHAELAQLLSLPGVRLSKSRSSFAHNSHFEMEYSSLFRDTLDHTGETCDAAAFVSGLRNVQWGGEELLPGGPQAVTEGYTAVVDEEFSRLLVGVRQRIYEAMTGSAVVVPPAEADDLASVVQSIG